MEMKMHSRAKMLREPIFFMYYRSTENDTEEKKKDKIDFSK